MAYEAINQALDQVSTLPGAFEHPATAAAVIAAGAGIYTYEHLRFRHTQTEYGVAFSNPALLKRSAEDITGKPVGDKLAEHTWSRLGSRLLMIGGLSIAAAAQIAHPTYETTTANTDANVAVVLDGSFAMDQTSDLGDKTTRYQAAVEGLKKADYHGKMAVVEFGANNVLAIPLSADWHQQTQLLAEPAVNGNGGQLEAAVESAARLLPVTLANNTEAHHTGTVVVVSDGILENTPQQLSDEAKVLQDQGVNVRVIVPGTPDGSYKERDNRAVSSSIKPEVFQAFGKDNVTIASTHAEVTDAVKKAVADSGRTKRRKDWNVPLFAGAAFFVGGLIRDGRQRVRKVI